jgi:type II secretory pathway predicted ATPase ExeA
MYNKFYGFSEKPFEVTPDPRFLYFTPSHQEALDSMMDGVKNRRGFITVTGEAGTGKTTLIYSLLSLLNSLDEKVKTVYIFHSTITFRELLENILLELDLRVVKESNTTLLHRLAEYLTQMDADETIAVIIDEGQNLPDEVMQELQMFSNLEPKVIQILLVGQPELEEKLNSPGLRHLKQKIGIRCQISALNEKESKEYIDHRLRLVGSSSSGTFTPEAISMICLYAKGIPRVINVLCDNAFLVGYSLSKKEIDAGIIREVIKKMEGPSPQKTICSSIATVLREIRLSNNRLNFPLMRVSLAILFLLCLGGLILLTQGYLQRRPAKTWNVESSKSLHVDTEQSSTSPSPQETKDEIRKGGSPHPIRQPEPISSEFPQPVTPPVTSLLPRNEWDKLKEVVVVEEGQTLSYLAQKYYRMANITLVDLILDFNPEITNAHLIKVGQKINIPKITEELLIMQSNDDTYKIRVGTFQNPSETRVYSDERGLKGKEIEILPRRVSPEDTWYRVVVGKFDNRDQALNVIRLLKERGLLPFPGL